MDANLVVNNKREVVLPHGGYGIRTRYDIIQYRYAGGGHPGCGGYLEVLGVKNPPEDKCPIIIHQYVSNSDVEEFSFAEWHTLDDAITAFEKYWGYRNFFRWASSIKGFLRTVDCGQSKPWFYAEGDDRVVEDFVAPLEELF